MKHAISVSFVLTFATMCFKHAVSVIEEEEEEEERRVEGERVERPLACAAAPFVVHFLAPLLDLSQVA